MAPYDSDSSAGEEDDFTETNVLLGYASRDAGDDFISRLGGRPVCERYPFLYLLATTNADIMI